MHYFTLTLKFVSYIFARISVSEIIESQCTFKLKTILRRKKLIYLYQSDLKTNDSTNFCVAQLIDFVLTGMDKQRHTSMILIHLRKACDTSDHGVFLEKMKYVGFQTSVIKWLEPYLSNYQNFLLVIENVFNKRYSLIIIRN